MTQEEKQILLADLCARLPYGIKCYEADVEYTFDVIGTTTNNKEFVFSDGYERNLEQIKPYLRPMSSMTEEENTEMNLIIYSARVTGEYFRITDFYNKHHLDYHDLIGINLALVAPEDMYNIK